MEQVDRLNKVMCMVDFSYFYDQVDRLNKVREGDTMYTVKFSILLGF